MEYAKGQIRLNLGCGLQAHPGWINIDGSWNARLAKHLLLRGTLSALHLMPREKAQIPWSSEVFVHDIRMPLPFPDGAASAVYASHVLEHLYREEGQQLIRESFRVLTGGGILRVIVPDLQAMV
jgi:predicted SAM-dependent methyltransferase